VLTPKEETAPEGAAYRSQMIEEGSQSGQAHNALRAVLPPPDMRTRVYIAPAGFYHP